MNQTERCVLCSSMAQSQGLGSLDQQIRYTCQNCGTFRISDRFYENEAKCHLLSGYARELSEINNEAYFSTDTISAILDSPLIPHSIIDKQNKLLLWCYKKSTYLGQFIQVSDSPAICYAVNIEELRNLYYSLIHNGFLKLRYEKSDLLNMTQSISISLSGHKACEQLLSKQDHSMNVFTAMWFHPDISNVYNTAIAPAIEECGFRPIRVDNIEHNNDITDEIIAGIKNSRFVVADMTGYRGGVYYEAGFARGLGKPVIFTCRRDWFDGVKDDQGHIVKEKIHFDVNHLNIIVWDTENDLKIRIINRIRATII